MGIPKALTSAERDITQPSLLDNTITGWQLRSGLNTFSQDTKKLLQSAKPIILDIDQTKR